MGNEKAVGPASIAGPIRGRGRPRSLAPLARRGSLPSRRQARPREACAKKKPIGEPRPHSFAAARPANTASRGAPTIVSRNQALAPAEIAAGHAPRPSMMVAPRAGLTRGRPALQSVSRLVRFISHAQWCEHRAQMPRAKMIRWASVAPCGSWHAGRRPYRRGRRGSLLSASQ